jgi:hypothetical protein
MASYFKINFIEPGKNLGPEPSKEKIQRLFNKELGISPLLLIGFIVLMVTGGIFYFTAVYLPLDKDIKYVESRLATLETEYKVKSDFRQERVAKAKDALKTIEQLNKVQQGDLYWSERMKVLNRTLVDNLWLSSMQIMEVRQPVVVEKKHGKKSGHGKKDEKNKEKQTAVKGYKVTIRGATYTNPAKKPLKKISKFMTNLIDEPYWGDFFLLKDWNISTSEEVTNFEVILESKKL